MRYVTLGSSGIKASVVGLGTWAIGGWMWGGTDTEQSIAGIHAAIDADINLIDTAPVYGFGTSEEIVGRAIRDRRDRVVLATKCGLVWDTDQGDFFFSSSEDMAGAGDDRTVYRYLGPESIRREVEASLRRLQTDYLDLYQTHWQESTTPIAETMAELLRLKDEGKIRAIGVSNATPAQMDDYRAVGPVDSDQEKYSMLDRQAEAEALSYCGENNIAFLAYSPIAQGLLTGKMGPERTFAETDQRSRSKRFSAENRRRAAALLDDLRPVAEAHEVTPAQLAIAWAVSQPGSTHALVGARSVRQATENAAAGDVELTADEQAAIERALQAHSDVV